MLGRTRMVAPVSLAPSPCMLVLWLSICCGAQNHVDMLLTTYSGRYSYIQIYRFSEENFQTLYECLCHDDKICQAQYYRTYTPSHNFTVYGISETNIPQYQDPSKRCRYFTCSAQLQEMVITCRVFFSTFSLSASNLQLIHYTKNLACPQLCSTFYWSAVNETLIASPSNLFEECESGCSDRSSSTRAVKSTTTTFTTSTTNTVRATKNSTQTSSASSGLEISSSYSTEKSSASITSSQLSNATSSFNVSLSLKQTNEASTTIAIAVVVPLLIVIIIGVVLVVFLRRRRQLSKQQMPGQNVQGTSVVLTPSTLKQEPSNTYFSLTSQKESQKNKESEESISFYESVDSDFKGSNLKTFSISNKCTPNSSKVVNSKANFVESTLQYTDMHNIMSDNSTGSRIVYLPNRNSIDESEYSRQSIYSLATFDVLADADVNATEKQLKKKQHMNTRPGENENSKIKPMVIIVKQDVGCDQENPYMDIDNTETGYNNVAVAPLIVEGINETKSHEARPGTTIEEIYIGDNAATKSSSTSGIYNNIALESDNAAQINLDGQQDNADFDDESPSYYYSSNTEVLRNINREKDMPVDVAVKSSGKLRSHVDKDNQKTTGEFNKYIVVQLSNQDQMSSTNMYSNLRDTQAKIIHPYN